MSTEDGNQFTVQEIGEKEIVINSELVYMETPIDIKGFTICGEWANRKSMKRESAKRK